MGFAGNELLKAAEFLNVNSSTGLFILFLFLSSLLAFFVLAFSYAFIDTPLTSKVISRSWVRINRRKINNLIFNDLNIIISI